MKQISRNNGSMPSSPNKSVTNQPRASGQHKHTTETKSKKRKSSLSSLSMQGKNTKTSNQFSSIPSESSYSISIIVKCLDIFTIIF